MPVILSIENHLDKVHQDIMARKFKEILVDLYIFPADKKPDHIPTLGELKNKFIIKCSGKRLWVDEEIERKNMDKNKRRLRAGTLDNDKMNLKKLVLIDDNLDDVIDSDDENKTEENPNNDENSNEEEQNKNTAAAFFPRKSFLPAAMAKQFVLFKQMVSESENNLLKRMSYGPELLELAIVPSLESVRGFLGTKFEYEKIKENKYKPWDFVTLKSTKLINFF